MSSKPLKAVYYDEKTDLARDASVVHCPSALFGGTESLPRPESQLLKSRDAALTLRFEALIGLERYWDFCQLVILLFMSKIRSRADVHEIEESACSATR